MKQKQWNPGYVELKPVIVTIEEYEQRVAELANVFYDEFCQRLKLSQVKSLGMIQQVQEIELKRTGTDD